MPPEDEHAEQGTGTKQDAAAQTTIVMPQYKYTKLDACRNTPIKDTRTMEDSTMPAVMASSFGPGPRVGAKVNVVRHADKCAHCGALDGKP